MPAVMRHLAAKAESSRAEARTDAGRSLADAERDKWIRVELFLVILEATGRRLGSIRQLRWEDINLTVGEITWRAAADKKRHDWLSPIPPAFVQELRTFQRKLGTVGGWVFPSHKDPKEPVRGDVLPRQLLRAEREAKLQKLAGGICHPYRRKWATERKHLSIKDVAAAGGWKDVETLLTCYQHADRGTMLEVMSEPKKVTERGVVNGE
jgi:integrase